MRFDRLSTSGLGAWGLLAFAALGSATEYFVDGAFVESRDLLEVRDTPICPNSYQSSNGMNFTTYCDQNNPFNDAYNPFQVSSMQECMERCSRYWGDSEGCYGIVWNQDNQKCWIRNSTTSSNGLSKLTGTHSALVPRAQLTRNDTDCPFNDASVQTLDSGEAFTIHCGKVIGEYDTCFEEYPECLQSPFIGYWHADSLMECMNICRRSHPLCQAVSWNPGMEIGFANCWPKTGFNGAINNPPSNIGVFHTATLSDIGGSINTTCPADSYSAKGGKTFDIHCGQLNQGTNITSMHRQNISSCMDTCVSSNNGCVGILFDSTLQGGYQNCYLQNSTSVISNNPNTTYALLSGTSIPSTKPSGGAAGKKSSSSSSKAWIAGPVIGGIVAIGLIAGGLFWWRKRKHAGPRQPEFPSYTGYQTAPSNNPYSPPPQELGTEGQHVEMAAADSYAPNKKYAQHAPNEAAPQELPT